MNALCEITKITNMQMTDLADGKAGVSELRTIAWCSAVEGEAADGRDLSLSEIEFGRLMTMETIVAFSKILTEQSGNSGQKKSNNKGQLPKIFFRKKV
jgi:hypothetical protein